MSGGGAQATRQPGTQIINFLDVEGARTAADDLDVEGEVHPTTDVSASATTGAAEDRPQPQPKRRQQ